MANPSEDNNTKPTSSSIEKMTFGFILSSAADNNNSNNNSNDNTTSTSSEREAIDTPRSVTSSPEEGDDSKVVGGNLAGSLDVGNADSSTARGDNSEVTTLGKSKNIDGICDLIKSRPRCIYRITCRFILTMVVNIFGDGMWGIGSFKFGREISIK